MALLGSTVEIRNAERDGRGDRAVRDLGFGVAVSCRRIVGNERRHRFDPPTEHFEVAPVEIAAKGHSLAKGLALGDYGIAFAVLNN